MSEITTIGLDLAKNGTKRTFYVCRRMSARSAPTETDCVAGHVGLELRNVVANYPFESSRGFPDPSRISAMETTRV